MQRLIQSGVPIDGIGLQMHLDQNGRDGLGTSVTANDLATNIGRLTALGLEVHITEMDVRLSVQQGPTNRRLSLRNSRTSIAPSLNRAFRTHTIQRLYRPLLLDSIVCARLRRRASLRRELPA